MSRIEEALAKAGANGPQDVLHGSTDGAPPADLPLTRLDAEAPPSDGALERYPVEALEASEPAPTFEAISEQHHPLETGDGFARIPRNERLMSEQADPSTVEQYRRLAGRLHLSQAERGTKVLLVTSALVGEGKTLTATNLALTLSESYKKKVLLIDADLRLPSVHELFEVPNLTGLNDGLNSPADRKVPVIRFSEYLSVVTAGRPEPDPMSVLTGSRMRRILEDAAQAFDWVIIDTPPVALMTDAHLLATLVDSVVLVVRAGKTPLDAIRKATEAVGRERVLGVVLNCGDAAMPASAYHYYSATGGAIARTAR